MPRILPRTALALRTALAGMGLVLVACERRSAPAVAAAAPAAPSAPTGPRGELRGAVRLTGKAPEMEELRRGTEPFCGRTPMKDEAVLAPGGKLKNVLVRVVGAPAEPPPAGPVEIMQDNCMYRPRVVGVVAGQTVQIKNGDPVLHNIRTYKGTSTLFNQAQVPSGPHIERRFSDAGALLTLRCDVHQWMRGYVWVQNNPHFAVTGDDGMFTIRGIPAGTYEVEAWHERYGVKRGRITIAADRPAELGFDYDGTEVAAN